MTFFILLKARKQSEQTEYFNKKLTSDGISSANSVCQEFLIDDCFAKRNVRVEFSLK